MTLRSLYKIAWRVAMGIAVMVAVVQLARPDRRLIATVFDIGQGDAILVQCGTAQLLVDGGPDNSVLSKLGATMPFFDRTIESIVLTHPHADHFMGLIGVLERYKVGRVFVSEATASSPEYRAFLHAAETAGLEPTIVQTGDQIAIGECGHGDVLWPDPRRTDVLSTKDLNADSVVLRVQAVNAVPRAALLLTGDATQEVEAALLETAKRTGSSLAADALKVGHHGSRTSSSPAFLDAVAPLTAAISVGVGNKYGHPTSETLARLKARGIAVLRTDLDGDITLELGELGVKPYVINK